MIKRLMTLDQESKVQLLKNNGWKLLTVSHYLAYLSLRDRLAFVNKDGLITYEDEDGR